MNMNEVRIPHLPTMGLAALSAVLQKFGYGTFITQYDKIKWYHLQPKIGGIAGISMEVECATFAALSIKTTITVVLMKDVPCCVIDYIEVRDRLSERNFRCRHMASGNFSLEEFSS